MFFYSISNFFDYFNTKFKAGVYRTNIAMLLMPSEGRRRLRHTMHGNLGELFRNFDDSISKPRGSNSLVVHDMETDVPEIYDKVNKEWIPLTNDLRERIPPTFSFAPRPRLMFLWNWIILFAALVCWIIRIFGPSIQFPEKILANFNQTQMLPFMDDTRSLHGFLKFTLWADWKMAFMLLARMIGIRFFD